MKRLAVATGFSFAGVHTGVKLQRRDLALVVSDRPAVAVAVTTRNELCASAVRRTRRVLPSTVWRAAIVCSGNANCLAGPSEAQDDARMAVAAARALGCDPDQVLTASTGPIGVPLPIEKVEAAVPALVSALARDIEPAADAILTTDRVPKLASRVVELPGGTVTITGFCKGSGMIHPNLATMLAFVVTDAAAGVDELGRVLGEAVAGSFNQISVDRDTSTNDMLLLVANGASGVRVGPGDAAFGQAVAEVCEELARLIAADGEGATRLVAVEVSGAPTVAVGRALARAVIESSLFKCSIFGDSSGWGRALAALGARAAAMDVRLDPRRVGVEVGTTRVVEAGQPTGEQGSVRGPEVRIGVELGLGSERGAAWGCDFSYDYVSINAVTKADPLETHSPGLKRRLLVEALGYIRRFRGKLAVIKYGGAAMLREDLQDAFAEDVVLLQAAGLLPVIVHGGGPEISRMLDKLGEPSRFVDGIRVTDASSMKVVEMVLSGGINTDIVTRIHKLGGRAVGLSGKDGGLLTATKLEVPGQDLGMVGEVDAVRTEVITMLLERGYLPVISPVGVDAAGTTYNINADNVAARLAGALGAEKVLFLSDVAGILEGDTLHSQISPDEARELCRRGVVRGGMIPKVQALLQAIEAGVKSAHIIDGRVPHNLLAELFTDRGAGTWIVRGG
jgi:acetylglutamate kinase